MYIFIGGRDHSKSIASLLDGTVHRNKYFAFLYIHIPFHIHRIYDRLISILCLQLTSLQLLNIRYAAKVVNCSRYQHWEAEVLVFHEIMYDYGVHSTKMTFNYHQK